MFKIASERTFTVPVKVMVPVDGGHEKQEFRATFKVVDVERLSQAVDLETQDDLLREVFTGFDDVQGVDGQLLPFSNNARDSLIGTPFVRGPLLATYLSAVTKAAAGN